jgi:8-oxo-dGTP diphosphatase
MKEMTAAIIIEEKKVLLVHNYKHGRIRIEPPGGKKEDGESLEKCVCREVEEELGVKIAQRGLFGVYETNSPEGYFRVSMYFSDIVEGRPRVMEPGKIPAFGWYRMSDLKRFEKWNFLVPNLCSSLNELKKYID